MTALFLSSLSLVPHGTTFSSQIQSSKALLGKPSPLTFSRNVPINFPTGQRKFLIRAAETDEKVSDSEDDFESRLAGIRRGGSGTGKKAEIRKMRRTGETEFDFGQTQNSSSGSAPRKVKEDIVLSPVAISDPKSFGGFPVQLGFSEYAEKLNGNLSAIGLGALISVELFSGKSLLTFHDPSTLSIQVYFILGVAALYIKWEKERKSVWPN